MTLPLVFLSGAGLPTWIWDDVRAGLPVGAAVVAPRPPGAADVADHAAAALAAAPPGPFGVVAHSAGGVVAAELARLAAGRVAAVLAVAAVIPRDGGSFTSSMPAPARFVLPLVLRVAGTRPPEAAVRRGLAAGLDDAVVDRLVADLEPESRGYFTGRVGSTAALAAVARRAYLVTTADTEIAAASQHRFAGRLGAGATEVTEVTEVAAGHLPMLSHPDVVRDAVTRLAASG